MKWHRRALLVASLCLTVFATWKVSQDEAVSIPVEATPPTRRVAVKPSATASVPELVWPTQSPSSKPVIDLFSPILTTVAVKPPPVVAGPVMPVFHLKYVGRLDAVDNHHVFLADAKDQIVVAKVGQALDEGGWTLKAIDTQKLVFHHTATGQEHILQIGSPQ